MSNALLYLGGLLITALAVLFAVPYFVDWNSYRGVFEEEASRVLGRDVRVGGAVNLHLLPAPYIGFEKVRISDSEGEGGTSIFRVESFTMWLSVPPLLRGVIEAHQVELRKPIIQLALDREGGGNWRSLAFHSGSLPLVPKDVALQSVRIVDGTIAVSAPARADLMQLEAINGEFSAEALEGPFKFRGTLKWAGAERGVRVATAKRSANGDIRFKGSVDAPETSNSYLLDGRISDLSGRPRFDGELTAKISLAPEPPVGQAAHEGAAPVPAAPPPQQHAEGPPGPEAKTPAAAPPASDPLASPELQLTAPAVDAHGRPKFDLRAKVEGDAAGFRLDDVNVMLEQGGPPQLITGSANLVWAEKMRLDVKLGSRWLDLDRLLGANSETTPLEAAQGYFEGLAAVLPAEADTNAVLEFDQLNLGGEAVSNVHLSASRADGPLELKGLRANLPGGTRLQLDGVLTPGQKTPKLDGTLAIAGQSLMRFLGWGLHHQTIGEGRNDGAFALDGRFALGDKKIHLTEATAEFAGMRLEGEARYEAGERKKIELTLDGPKIDAAQIRTGLLGASAVRDLLLMAGSDAGGTDAGKNDAAQGVRLVDPAQTDLALKLRAAEITDGTRVVRDVELEMGVDHGTFSLPVLKFATPEGLVVEAEGRASDKQGKTHGDMRGLIDAPTPAAALGLVDLLDLDPEQKASLERFARLAPLRLAGSLDYPGDASGAADFSVDGAVDGGRLAATVRLAGGQGGWRSHPIDVTATLDVQGVERFLSGAPAAGQRPGDAAGAMKPGRIVLKAAGTPANGMLSLLQISSEDFSADSNGRITLPAAGKPEYAGTVALKARDARSALSIAGLKLGEGAAEMGLTGTVSVHSKGGELTLAADDLVAGASRLRGSLTLKDGESGARTIAADLDIDSASVTGLMAPILGRQIETQPAAPVPATAQRATAPNSQQKAAAALAAEPLPGVWPEQVFDLSTVEGLTGRVTARVGTLALDTGLSVGEARLTALIAPGSLKIESLEGKALGGKLVSRLDFAKAAAGIGLEGSLRIDVSSGAAGANADAPGDVAALKLDFAGRALSPAALIADLKGKGEVALGDTTLAGMSPGAVTAVAEAALAGKGPTGGDALAQAIKNALRTGQLKLGKIAIPIEIGDGAMKLGRVKIESADGRSTFATAVELASMKIDSEWQIEPKVARPSNPTERVLLPAVTVVYVGRLGEIASLEPAVTTGALERELTVRKMERDVDELERLRKADQSRARQEIERQQAIDAERAKAASPPPAAAAPPQDNAAPVEQAQPGPSAGTPLPPAEGGPQSAADPADPTGAGSATDATAQPPLPGAEAAVPAEAVAPPRPRKKKSNDEWRPFQTNPF